MPIEEYTLENWLKGQVEMYEVEMLYYTEDFEFGRITEEQHKKANIEFEKIHNRQKEAFDEMVANNLKYIKFNFEQSAKRAKDKKSYIALEIKKIKRWLDMHPELLQNILSEKINYSFFDSSKYQEYLLEKKFWNKRPLSYYYDDPNINASVYTKHLEYLEELDPKEYLT